MRFEIFDIYWPDILRTLWSYQRCNTTEAHLLCCACPFYATWYFFSTTIQKEISYLLLYYICLTVFYWYDIRRHNTLLKQDKTSVWNFMSCNLCVKKTVCSCVFWSCFKCLFTWINAQFLKSSNNSIFYKTKQNLASKEGFIWWPFGGAFSGIVKHCSVWQNISVCFCLTQIYWNSCWLSSYSNCIWFALFPLCE